MNGLSSVCSLSLIQPSRLIPAWNTQTGISLTNMSGTNISYNINPTNYSITGASVYQIINTSAMSTTGGTTVQNRTGTFTLNVSSSPVSIYYIVIGGGGGGGSGNEGGGGGSSGEIKYGNVSLPVGTYSCSLQVGGGGPGSGYVESLSTFSNGAGGYGCVGGTSTLTINGTTITSIGGSPGGPSRYNNVCTIGAYGGGGGIGGSFPGTITGSNGQIKNRGGNSVNTSTLISSAGGGGSPMSSGSNGNTGSIVSGGTITGLGGLGGAPISTTAISNSFKTVQYFCEGGHGAAGASYNPSATVGGQISTYALAGYSSGWSSVAANIQPATQSVNHTGSGGSGAFQMNGLNKSAYAPSGANGVIIIYF